MKSIIPTLTLVPILLLSGCDRANEQSTADPTVSKQKAPAPPEATASPDSTPHPDLRRVEDRSDSAVREVVKEMGLPDRDALLLYECETFQFPGGWWIRGGPGALQDQILQVYLETVGGDAPAEPVEEAGTVIDVPRAGTYYVYARAMDYADQGPGCRRFTVAVNGQRAQKEAGNHGRTGFVWQELGQLPLREGRNYLSLIDTTAFFARADAVMFSAEKINPHHVRGELADYYRREPVWVVDEQTAKTPSSPGTPSAGTDETKTIQNENIHLELIPSKQDDGSSAWLPRVAVKVANEWHAPAEDPAQSELFVIKESDPQLSFRRFPRWDQARREATVTIGDKTFRPTHSASNPYTAGNRQKLTCVEAARVADDRLECAFIDEEGARYRGVWSITPGSHSVDFEIEGEVPEASHLSFGTTAFRAFPYESIREVQLPSLYNERRLPERPILHPSSMTPHPMALIELTPDATSANAPVTVGVVADPAELPYQWSNARNARYGFSLRNERNEAQPAIFNPVLGFDGSRFESGETARAAWKLFAYPGPWREAFSHLSEDVFRVEDYREPTTASLTEAVFNMMDLANRPEGWDAEHKGYYDIETKDMLKHGSPLMILSQSILMDDPETYWNRGLPTIEFTLSRKEPAGIIGKKDSLSVPTRFYDSVYWQGVDDLLGDLNPWLQEFIFPDGELYHSTVYNCTPPWSTLLAAYRDKPDPETLATLEAQAREWIDNEIHTIGSEPISYNRFYNIHFYPQWYDLLELYEITGDRYYIDAAESAAYHNLAGIWSHPLPPEGDLTLYTEEQVDSIREMKIWWLDGKRFRLGYPLADDALQPKSVPAWIPSNIGLSLETAGTYFHTQKHMGNILLSTWTPDLLRLHGHTGRDIFKTYARNGVIGRFANYPGYYQNSFQDQSLDADYPIKGPDITSIYYHHIATHLAFCLDFLIAEADVRSKSAIRFPYVRQQSYAWFNHRIYGGGEGKVFGRPARLLFDRNLLEIENPAIDWLTAASADQLYLICMNQTDAPQSFRIDWGDAHELSPDKVVDRLDASGQSISQSKLTDSFELEPDGMTVLRIPFSYPFESDPEARPLREGHLQVHLGGAWGNLHAFRIRSPFGRDSVYFVADGNGVPNAFIEAAMEVDDKKTPARKDTIYPYELSFIDLPVDAPIRARISVPDGSPLLQHQVVVELPADGSRGKISHSLVPSAEMHGKPILFRPGSADAQEVLDANFRIEEFGEPLEHAIQEEEGTFRIAYPEGSSRAGRLVAVAKASWETASPDHGLLVDAGLTFDDEGGDTSFGGQAVKMILGTDPARIAESGDPRAAGVLTLKPLKLNGKAIVRATLSVNGTTITLPDQPGLSHQWQMEVVPKAGKFSLQILCDGARLHSIPIPAQPTLHVALSCVMQPLNDTPPGAVAVDRLLILPLIIGQNGLTSDASRPERFQRALRINETTGFTANFDISKQLAETLVTFPGSPDQDYRLMMDSDLLAALDKGPVTLRFALDIEPDPSKASSGHPVLLFGLSESEDVAEPVKFNDTCLVEVHATNEQNRLGMRLTCRYYDTTFEDHPVKMKKSSDFLPNRHVEMTMTLAREENAYRYSLSADGVEIIRNQVFEPETRHQFFTWVHPEGSNIRTGLEKISAEGK